MLPGDPVESLQLIPPKAAAIALGISIHTLKRWRRRGEGPDWCRVGTRAIRYSVTSLEFWLETTRHMGSLQQQGNFGNPE